MGKGSKIENCAKYPKTWAFLLVMFIIIFLTVGGLNWWIYNNMNKKRGADDVGRAKLIALIYSIIILVVLVTMCIGVYFKPFRCLIINGSSKTQDISIIIIYILVFLALLVVEILGWYTYGKLNQPVVDDAILDSVRLISLYVASIITTIFGVTIIAISARAIVNRRKKKSDEGDESSISNFMKAIDNQEFDAVKYYDKLQNHAGSFGSGIEKYGDKIGGSSGEIAKKAEALAKKYGSKAKDDASALAGEYTKKAGKYMESFARAGGYADKAGDMMSSVSKHGENASKYYNQATSTVESLLSAFG